MLTILGGCQLKTEVDSKSRNTPVGVLGITNTQATTEKPTFQVTNITTPIPARITTIQAKDITPTPFEKECEEKQGKITPIQLKSDLLDAPLIFKIYLPPCYNPKSQVHYPVLILLHGMYNDENQWIRLGVNGIADSLIVSKKVKPFLIVLPREDDTLENPNESNYPNAIINVLIPWLDNHYATCKERECWAIGGLSRGSGWALRMGLTNWPFFGSIGAHSIAPFYGDPNRFPDWINNIPVSQRPRLYLDIGSSDEALQGGRDFDSLLSSKNFAHEWHIFEGYHIEEYWHSHLMDYLIWYAQPWENFPS